MSECSLAELTREAAGRLAKKVFAGDRDAETKVADTVSVAWELAQRARAGVTPDQVIRFAIRRVRSGRQFQQSIRSIDTEKRIDRRYKRQRPKRLEGFDVGQLADKQATPDAIVAVRLDTQVWWMGLKTRERAMAEMLAAGNSTSETADAFGVSLARISQVRRELWTKWKALQD